MQKEELARELIEGPVQVIGTEDGTDLRAVNLEIGTALLFVTECAAAYALRNDELNKDDLIATLSLEIGNALSIPDFEYVSDRFIEYARSVKVGGDVTANQLDSFVAIVSKTYVRQIESLVPTANVDQVLASTASLMEAACLHIETTMKQVDSAIAEDLGSKCPEEKSAGHTDSADSLVNETPAGQMGLATGEESESDLRMSESSDDTCKALVQAAGEHQVATVTSLIESGVDPNAVWDGRTALAEVLLSWKGSEEQWTIARTLLAHGAKIPFTSIYSAAGLYGDAKLVEALIESGADISGSDSVDGWTPLEMAVQYGRRDVVDLLIREGADPNSAGMAESLGRLYDKYPKNEFQVGKSITEALAGRQAKAADQMSDRKWWQFWRGDQG